MATRAANKALVFGAVVVGAGAIYWYTQRTSNLSVSFTGIGDVTLSYEETGQLTMSTALTNTGSSSRTYTLTADILPDGTTNAGVSGLAWYVLTAPTGATIMDARGDGISNSGVQLTIDPGQTVSVTWATNWEDAIPSEDGPYKNVLHASWGLFFSSDITDPFPWYLTVTS